MRTSHTWIGTVLAAVITLFVVAPVTGQTPTADPVAFVQFTDAEVQTILSRGPWPLPGRQMPAIAYRAIAPQSISVSACSLISACPPTTPYRAGNATRQICAGPMNAPVPLAGRSWIAIPRISTM